MVRITTPTGGRARRKSGAVSLAAADVPSVAPARDPGVRVPSTDAIIGAGVTALGEALGQEVDLQFQKQRRDEGLSRDEDETGFSGAISDTVRDMQDVGDFSDTAIMSQSKRISELRDEILENHQGGETSRRMLKNALDRKFNAFADTLAVLNVNQSNVREREALTRRISGVVQGVLEDPDVVLSDPVQAFREHSADMEAELDMLGLEGPRRDVAEREANAEIALSVITPLIANGEFDRAKDFLRSDEAGAVLEPGQIRDAALRINQAERKAAEVSSEADELMELSRRLLPPGASPEEVRLMARRLKNVETENNVKSFEVGNKVVFINEDTQTKVGEIELESTQEQADREAAVARAKLLAKKEVVTQMLRDVGAVDILTEPGTQPAGAEGEAPGQTPGGEGAEAPVEGAEPAAVVTPFGPEVQPSSDAQDVARLFLVSRRLFAIGENATANSLLSVARFIAENSPEIQRERELDKPISAELAAELGVELGTPLRAVVGMMPRSPEQRSQAQALSQPLSPDQAAELGVPVGTTLGEVSGIVGRTPEERARASATAATRGREQVRAEEQLAFIGEARIQITDLLEELVEDPTLVGAVGGLRATGRSAVTLLDDLGFTSLVNAARDLAFEETDLGLDEITGFFDNPTSSSLDILANSIGLILARLRTPAGRIPVELIRRSIDDVGLKGLRGGEVVQDRLRFVLKLLDQRSEGIKRRFPNIGEFDEGPAGEGDFIPSDVPRFRIEGGQLVPAGPGGGGATRPFGRQ